MKYLFSIALLIGSTWVLGQDKLTQRNSLSLTLFKLENTSATLHNHLEPKFVTGLSYERLISKWSWISTIEYGENLINDNCKNCADHYYGTGQLKELNFFTGYNYTFNQYSDSKIKFFTGTDAYISLMNYSGSFGGGWSGGGTNLDRNYLFIGGLQRIGIHYYPIQRLQLSLILSYRLGFGWRQNLLEQGYSSAGEGSATIPQLKIGFTF